MIIFYLHSLSIILLVIFVLKGIQELNLKINIHTIPIYLLSTLAVLFYATMCVVHFKLCLITGVTFSIFLTTIMSSAIYKEKPISISTKLIAFILMTLFWPELLTLIVFFIFNTKTNNEKSKP
jgi:hypothetical protein